MGFERSCGWLSSRLNFLPVADPAACRRQAHRPAFAGGLIRGEHDAEAVSAGSDGTLLILRDHRLPQSWVVTYAWNPLVIYELFSSGHLESFMIPPLMGFVYFFRTRTIAAGALLAGAHDGGG